VFFLRVFALWRAFPQTWVLGVDVEWPCLPGWQVHSLSLSLSCLYVCSSFQASCPGFFMFRRGLFFATSLWDFVNEKHKDRNQEQEVRQNKKRNLNCDFEDRLCGRGWTCFAKAQQETRLHALRMLTHKLKSWSLLCHPVNSCTLLLSDLWICV
jgi:hypothetical protein